MVFKETSDSERTVKCSYGISRGVDLMHEPLLKQHYPTRGREVHQVTRGRSRGGTPRVSETELISMMTQRLDIVARECL